MASGRNWGAAVTIHIYCEGETDKHILSFLLDHFQSELRPGKSPVALRVHPLGGSKYLTDIGKVVTNRIVVEQDPVVFGLIDFYGLINRFPKVAKWEGDPLPQRLEYITNQVKQRIPAAYRPQFHQHFAVHDIEAWLLADEGPLQAMFGRPGVGPWHRPETVNLSKPPSAVLAELYRLKGREAYIKSVNGPSLLSKASPKAILDKCPYFKMLIDDLMEACDDAVELPIPKAKGSQKHRKN